LGARSLDRDAAIGEHDAAVGDGERHRHVLLNEQDGVPLLAQPGDEIEVKNAPASRQIATRNLEENRIRNVPGWLTMNAEAFKATVVRLPTREEMQQDINEQLIVEFYSRF